MALAEIYHITGEPQYATAFTQIWWSLCRLERHPQGALFSAEQAHGSPYAAGSQETCCTVAWSAMSVKLLMLSPAPLSVVADELELSLFNTGLFCCHPSGSWITYNNHCDSEFQTNAAGTTLIYGRQNFIYTQSIGCGAGQAEQGSCQLTCCTVNGPRILGLLAEWALLKLPPTSPGGTPAGIVLNFFGPSVLRTTLGPVTVTLTQQTSYPFGNDVQINVGVAGAGTAAARTFEIWVRVPSWSAQTVLNLNGAAVPTAVGSYVKLQVRNMTSWPRSWANCSLF
jgi:DUF1680 family protein